MFCAPNDNSFFVSESNYDFDSNAKSKYASGELYVINS